MVTGGGNYSTWALNPAAAVVVVPPRAPAPPRGRQTSTIGFGLLAPFRRAGATDFASGGGIEQIKSRITSILGAKRSSPTSRGELPWRGEFGSYMHRLRHKSKTSLLQKLARQYAMDALAQWEPSVRVRSVTLVSTPNARRTLALRVSFDVVDVNPTGNRTILPGQTVDVPLSAAAG